MTPLDTAVLSVSGLSAFFDFKARRIPNWLIVFGLICGITHSAFQGTNILVQSILGFVAGIAALILPFAFGWIGAGDAKFFGVIGALLGISWLPRVFFYSALVAGVIALGYLIFGITRVKFVGNFLAEIKIAVLSMGRILPDPVHKKSHDRGGSVPWGVAFAAGTIIAYYVDPNGRWAGF